MNRKFEKPESLERRQFFDITAKYGFTSAVVAGAVGSLLVSDEAAAASAKEEMARQQSATHRMTIGTAYDMDSNS